MNHLASIKKKCLISPLRKIYINNLLTLVIWKCAYDRIVFIVKKGINTFSKKVF